MRVSRLIAATSLLCLTATAPLSAGTRQTPGVIPVGIQNPAPPPPPPDDPTPYQPLPYSGKRSIAVSVRVKPRDLYPRPSDHVHVTAYVTHQGKKTKIGEALLGDIFYYSGSRSPAIPAGHYTEPGKFETTLPGVISVHAHGLNQDYHPVDIEEEIN